MLLTKLLRGTALEDQAAVSDREITGLTCDSRTVTPGALFAAFRGSRTDGNRFIREALDKGATAVLCQTPPAGQDGPWLVTDDPRAVFGQMAAHWFGDPGRRMTLIGVTGTNGKTTTTYLLKTILEQTLGAKVGLIGTNQNLVGHEVLPARRTTPDAYTLQALLAKMEGAGCSHVVMEVSSQAYKVDRVYGLTFDVAAFLNISPDHISPIEHPTFEDYLYCKRQIIVNAKSLVLGADSLHADLLREDAEAAGIGVTTFALHDADNAGTSADVVAWPADPAHASFHIADGDQALGDYHLSIDGDFNYLNAAAAIAIAHAVGVSLDDADALHAIESVRIAGRMEQFRDPQSNTLAIVDYAHNYASVTALLDFVYERWGEENPRITLVTGSAGNKAYDRRKEIVEAAENRIANFIFTAEDTDTEPIIDICMEMQGYITNKDVVSTVISDRLTAITNAIYDARAHADRFNILLIIGKGNERWIKDHRKHVPFDGDDHVVERMFGL